MRIIILKTNEVETACDAQDNECNGINCKTCQFNKIGVDVEFLKNKIYTATLDFLNKNQSGIYDSTIYDKATGISDLVISIITKEESDQATIGSKIFKKIIH